jgi:Mg2+/Co2+ transporter CorB
MSNMMIRLCVCVCASAVFSSSEAALLKELQRPVRLPLLRDQGDLAVHLFLHSLSLLLQFKV